MSLWPWLWRQPHMSKQRKSEMKSGQKQASMSVVTHSALDTRWLVARLKLLNGPENRSRKRSVEMGRRAVVLHARAVKGRRRRPGSLA